MSSKYFIYIVVITSFGCTNPENKDPSIFKNKTESQTVKKSITFDLVDNSSQPHGFNIASLKLYSDETYFFNYDFSGGYKGQDTGTVQWKQDTLSLNCKKGYPLRTLKFVETREEADFHIIDGNQPSKTPFLKIIKLNIDRNCNTS